MILCIRTDNPDAELALASTDGTPAAQISWPAHRRLAETLHEKIRDLLDKTEMSPGHIEGIVVYQGPGSFTGLRIGISVANALAYSLHVPIIGETTASWKQKGCTRIGSGEDDGLVLPEYGAEVRITQQKK